MIRMSRAEPMNAAKPIGVTAMTASRSMSQPIHFGRAPAPRTTDSPVADRNRKAPIAIGRKSFCHRAFSVTSEPGPTSSAVSAIVNRIVASIAPPIAIASVPAMATVGRKPESWPRSLSTVRR